MEMLATLKHCLKKIENKSTAWCIIRPFKFGHKLEPLRESMCDVTMKFVTNPHTELDDARVKFFTNYRVHKLTHGVDISELESRSR